MCSPATTVRVGERDAPTAGALAHGAIEPLRGMIASGAGSRQLKAGMPGG